MTIIAAEIPPVICWKVLMKRSGVRIAKLLACENRRPRRSRRIWVPCSIMSLTHSGFLGRVAMTQPYSFFQLG